MEPSATKRHNTILPCHRNQEYKRFEAGKLAEGNLYFLSGLVAFERVMLYLNQQEEERRLGRKDGEPARDSTRQIGSGAFAPTSPS